MLALVVEGERTVVGRDHVRDRRRHLVEVTHEHALCGDERSLRAREPAFDRAGHVHLERRRPRRRLAVEDEWDCVGPFVTGQQRLEEPDERQLALAAHDVVKRVGVDSQQSVDDVRRVVTADHRARMRSTVPDRMRPVECNREVTAVRAQPDDVGGEHVVGVEHAVVAAVAIGEFVHGRLDPIAKPVVDERGKRHQPERPHRASRLAVRRIDEREPHRQRLRSLTLACASWGLS